MVRRWCYLTVGCLLFATASGESVDLSRAVASASALRNAQRHAEARAAFAHILAIDPANPDANYFLGLYACDAGNWEQALAYEAKAIAAEPANPRYQYGWGAANGVSAMKAGIFSKLGYARKCLAAYRRAAELEPTNPQYHSALLSYYQQAPGFAGGDLTLAYAQAAELKKLDPEFGRSAYAQLYVGEKKYDLAFREYEEALRQSPDDYRTLFNYGLLTVITSRRLDAGIAALHRCLKLTAAPGAPSHAAVHWRLGNLWEKKGKPQDARTEYLAALKEDSNFGPAKQALQKLVAVPPGK